MGLLLATAGLDFRLRLARRLGTPLDAPSPPAPQIPNLWKVNPGCQEFSFGKRLARIAAELMQARGGSQEALRLPCLPRGGSRACQACW